MTRESCILRQKQWNKCLSEINAIKVLLRNPLASCNIEPTRSIDLTAMKGGRVQNYCLSLFPVLPWDQLPGKHLLGKAVPMPLCSTRDWVHSLSNKRLCINRSQNKNTFFSSFHLRLYLKILCSPACSPTSWARFQAMTWLLGIQMQQAKGFPHTIPPASCDIWGPLPAPLGVVTYSMPNPE